MPKEKSLPTSQSNQAPSHQRMNAALGIAPQSLIAKPPIKQEKKLAPFLTMGGVTILTMEEMNSYYTQINQQVGKLTDEEFNGKSGRKLMAEVARVHILLPKNNPTTTVKVVAPKENLVKTSVRFNLRVNPIRGINAVLPANALTPANTSNHSMDVQSSSPRSKLSVC